MTKKEFLRLKRWIDKMLVEAHDDILNGGGTIENINQVLPIVKAKLLETKGVDPQAYLDWEEKMAEGKLEEIVPVERNPFEEEEKRQAIKKELASETEKVLKEKTEKIEQTKKEIEAGFQGKIKDIEKEMEAKEELRERTFDLKEAIAEKERERKEMEDSLLQLEGVTDSDDKFHWIQKLERGIENCKGFEAEATRELEELKNSTSKKRFLAKDI